jgi:anti-anti-sigma regulatory factor
LLTAVIMMRITTTGTKRGARLAVEGRVTGAAVDELAGSCEACLDVRAGVTLDLSAVTFVDARGVRVLRGAAERGARLVGCSAFLKALLAERVEG